MGIKRHYQRRTAERLGLPAHLGDERRVAAVDAIEVADGYSATAAGRRKRSIPEQLRIKHANHTTQEPLEALRRRGFAPRFARAGSAAAGRGFGSLPARAWTLTY